MSKHIYLDMDGTLADLYNVKGWLNDIKSESTIPYKKAKPLITEKELLSLLNKGYILGIISWTAKNGSKHYNRAVRNEKISWLKKNYPSINFGEIHIIKYGTPKSNVIKDKNSILIDDDKNVRKKWKGKSYHPSEFFKGGTNDSNSRK